MFWELLVLPTFAPHLARPYRVPGTEKVYNLELARLPPAAKVGQSPIYFVCSNRSLSIYIQGSPALLPPIPWLARTSPVQSPRRIFYPENQRVSYINGFSAKHTEIGFSPASN